MHWFKIPRMAAELLPAFLLQGVIILIVTQVLPSLGSAVLVRGPGALPCDRDEAGAVGSGGPFSGRGRP